MKPLALALVFWAYDAFSGSIDPSGSTKTYSTVQAVKGSTATMQGAYTSFVAANPPSQVVTLAADFAPTQLSNLWAFCEVKTDLTNAWGRIATMPYPANGGTFAVSYTNTASQLFYRFGYQFPP